MSEIRNKLEEVFRDVFDDPSIVLSEGLTAEDVDGWDSLTHINLIIAIQRQFGVKFATAEISQLKEHGADVGDLLEMLTKKMHSRR